MKADNLMEKIWIKEKRNKVDLRGTGVGKCEKFLTQEELHGTIWQEK